MLSRQTTLEPTTRRQPYVSYKQGGKPCLSLCKKTRRQPYVTYVAYVLMYLCLRGKRYKGEQPLKEQNKVRFFACITLRQPI